MPRIVREHAVLTIVWMATVSITAALAFAAGSPSTPVYVVQVLVATVVVGWVYRGTRLSTALLWALAVWGAAHLAGGLVPFGDGVLYNARPVSFLPQFDQMVHAFGFGASAISVGQVLRARTVGGPAMAVVAGLGGLGVGAINEVLEFASTRTLPATNVGGYANTGWDMVANLAGAAAAALWLGFTERRAG